MWVVQVALRRPYTFIVLALLIAIFGALAALRTPVDIFPNINIPVVSVVWTYTGLSPSDMSGRVIYYYERTLTAQVGDIDHIESQSLDGYGVVKIFFQRNVDIRTALAQVTAASQTVLKLLPPGITPPYVLSYNASSVPILKLALSSKRLPQMKLFDAGQNFIRPQRYRQRRGRAIAIRRQDPAGAGRPLRPHHASAAGCAGLVLRQPRSRLRRLRSVWWSAGTMRSQWRNGHSSGRSRWSLITPKQGEGHQRIILPSNVEAW